MKAYRIVFAGTPDFAAVALQALLSTRHSVVAVYTQPDRPAGRGQHVIGSPVKQLALQHQLPVQQPENFRDTASLTTLASYQPDVIIVAAYGLILPLAVLNTPNIACLNIHASLLPRWRGAAPIQKAILAGDQESGITIMKMAEGLDTGDMLLKRSTSISDTDTGSSLHDRLAALGANAMLEVLDDLATLLKQACPQIETDACYAKKLSKEEARINWHDSVETIHRQVRAFNSWPVAYSTLGENVVRIWEAEFTKEAHTYHPGEICAHVESKIQIAAKNGFIFLKRLQLPGGKVLDSKDILNSKQSLFQTGSRFE